MKRKILLVAGARPNFVKLAPLLRSLQPQAGIDTITVHTGQHYDHAMSESFFQELRIPPPQVNLEVGSGSHAQQTATIMARFEPVLEANRPDWVVVFGDVNSTIACALVAAKAGAAVAHVEAGLRSNDWSMPEEVNRVLTDRLSQRLYTPSRDANDNLIREGTKPDYIKLVGNIMVDTLKDQLPRIDQKAVLSEHQLHRGRFVLVTLHRPSSVDDPATLARLCEGLREAAEQEPVLLPAHPRTIHRLGELGLRERLGGVRLMQPLPYPVFLGLMASARVVVTDSGGVQEETTALGVPCITARQNTERPITITEGTNQLFDPTSDGLVAALREADGRRGRVPELWDGHTAERIVADLLVAQPERR
jgi:UDP-N-acetylglucosamine 2-epimerase (non-hydrolysing)